MEMMVTIQSSFGILPEKSRDERRIVLAMAVETSLFIYFATKQLIQTGSDDDSDEVIRTTYHLFSTIEDHESRISWTEERQKQLDKLISGLSDLLVLGLRTEDMFATIL